MNVSLAHLLVSFARAVVEDAEVAWSGVDGRLDIDMMLAARRSIAMNRQPVALPLFRDAAKEEAFDLRFEDLFGVHPRADLERALVVSYKAR